MCKRLFTVCLSLALAGCDLFIVKVGGDGEPCADNGACDEGLVCNFDECVQPREEGDECDDSWVRSYDWMSSEPGIEWLESFEVCEEDLCCNNGECGDGGDMVHQPETTHSWDRCPRESQWSACHCDQGIDAQKISTWDNAFLYEAMCLGDKRLPSKEEYISILDDCDSSVTSGGEGFCDPCDESDVCSAMFSFLDTEEDLVMFTGSYSVSGDGETVAIAWFVDLKTGEIFQKEPESSSMRAAILCLVYDP